MANWRGFHSWVWDSCTFPQFIYEFHLQNTANTSPLHICLISSQPACTWLISYKADCHLMLLALQTVALIFNEIDKNLNFTCVIVFPLPLRRQLISFLHQMKAIHSCIPSYIQCYFLGTEKKISSQKWVDSMDFISCSQTLSSLRSFCVSNGSNQIQFFSLCSETTHFRLNSSLTSKLFNSTLVFH